VTPAKNHNHGKRGFQKTSCSTEFFLAAAATNFGKHDFSTASQGAFPGILGWFFYMLKFSKTGVQVHIKSLRWSIVTKHFSFPKKKSKLEYHGRLLQRDRRDKREREGKEPSLFFVFDIPGAFRRMFAS